MILWSRVQELRDEVGDEDFAEVVELFLEEVEAALDRLATAPENVREELHFLKGSALNLGFRGLALACLTAEQSEDGAMDLSDLPSIYRNSKTKFLDELDLAA
ncbi:MAG: Hpt domain-containing protein [Rhodobacteraceae bacterium]|nr:Hpt domain-containing protein [Paracoccaceae bacterium]